MDTTTKLGSLAILVCGLGLVGCAGYVSVDSRPQPAPAPTVESEPRPEQHQGPPPHTAHLGIPPGHLPPPGQCRIWIPGRPPGHQPRSGACSTIERQVAPGQWLIHRPSRDKRHVRVTIYGSRQPEYVVAVRLYEAETGRFVRDE